MTDRITNKMLEQKIDYLNKLTGNPLTPWTQYRAQDGKLVTTANQGNYHLGGAYGKVELSQMCTDGGGVHTIFPYCTKRELFDRLRAYINGIEVGKELQA